MNTEFDPRKRQSSSGYIPELLTAKELEALLKIDVKTIYSYVQRGLIPYVRIESNVRFLKQQIIEWIEERNYRPRGQGNGTLRGKRKRTS